MIDEVVAAIKNLGIDAVGIHNVLRNGGNVKSFEEQDHKIVAVTSVDHSVVLRNTDGFLNDYLMSILNTLS